MTRVSATNRKPAAKATTQYTATGTAPVENLSTNCGYDWTFTQGSAVSHSRLANASMATVLSGFQVLLKEQAHVGWKDIGLTGY